ncbi:translation initiation factor III [Actinoplanes sp. NPDC051494]|uniref:translation initiation factor III n=1 Tax=Actinoplanes sp. NPDC051494 TaxID=3363907 RepID=UPI0037AC76FB
MGATGGRTPPSKLSIVLLGTSILAVIWAVMMMVPAGRVAYVYIFYYFEFYMGVITLVSLSITIMVGLVSTDRLVLSIRQRLLLQSTHRTTGVIAVVALFIHLWTKLAMGKMQAIDIFIPFLNPGKTLFIGFGTISAYVMVLVMWTGIARARFIGRGKPWMWRGIHSISYLMWPIAILHGLNTGRPGAVFVIVGYVLCVLVVLIGLAVRIAVSLNRRKDFASQQGTAGGGGTGGMKPVGSIAAAGGLGKGRGRGRRDDDALVSDRGNAVQAWKPAAPRPAPAAAAPPVAEAPAPAPMPAAAPAEAAPMPVGERDDRRPRRDDPSSTQRWEFEDEDDMPVRRPRQRRPVDDERFDEPTGALSRRALDEGLRRYEDEDEMPAPRTRRRDEGYDDAPPARSRRAEPEFDDEPAPRPRARRDVEDTMTGSRSRRAFMDDVEDTMTGSRSRRAFMGDVEDTMTGSRSRRDLEDTMTGSRSRREVEDTMTGSRSRRALMDDVEDTMTGSRSRRALLGDDDTGSRSRRALMEGGDMPAPRRRADEDDDPRPRRYADEEPPAPRQRRRDADDRYEDPRYDEAPRRRTARYDDEPPRAPRASRYEEAEDAPRARRDRGADVDRADSGRHSRSEFVDLAADDTDFMEPDETPTLVDMAQRRARRAEQPDSVRGAGVGRGARRGPSPRGRAADDTDDANYWAQLRGEAQ